MRQIAHEAHVTPAAIYNHFDGKEAIFLALLAERMPQRALVRALSTVEGETVEDLIHDAFRRMGAAMEDQFDNLRLLFVELLEFQGRHARHVAEEFLPQALAFINRVQSAEGDLRPLDPMIGARAFLGLFMSCAITVAFFPRVSGFVARDSDLHDLGNILLHGLLAPPPGSDAAGNAQGGQDMPGVA
jgi:AcrR family transcriptional regulator